MVLALLGFAALLDDAEFVNLDGLTSVLFSLGLNGTFFVAACMLGDATRKRMENEVELGHRADALAAERDERAPGRHERGSQAPGVALRTQGSP